MPFLKTVSVILIVPCKTSGPLSYEFSKHINTARVKICPVMALCLSL